MTSDKKSIWATNGGIILGCCFILLGVLFLLEQNLDLNVWPFGWPVFVLLPGFALIAFSLVAGENAGEGLAISGGILSMIGLLLLYQNTTNHWESWTYAWALVAPTGVGLAQIFYGNMKDKDYMVQTGTKLVRIGLAIFLVGAFFFEFVIGISGIGLGRFGWPILLIAIGAYILFRALKTEKKTSN